MAYPSDFTLFVDPDYGFRPHMMTALCTYINQIVTQQSGGSTFNVPVPDQASSVGQIPSTGAGSLNNCIAAMNATITRASLGTTPMVLYGGLDYSAYTPAVNAVATFATTVKHALGG